MQRSLLSILLQHARSRHFLNASRASSSSEPGMWDICASVALLRPPLIAPPMNEVEKEYSDCLRAIEYEHSLMANFELDEIQDQKLLAKRAELEAQGKDLSEMDEKIGISAMARRDDWERKGESLKQKFSIGHFSKAQKDSETSIWRRLDRQLVLIVKQKFQRKDNYKSPWILPQSAHRAGETLRQTAERCLGEILNGDVKARISGNAPFAVYTYRYALNLKRQGNSKAMGCKVFFYNSLLLQRDDIEVNKDELAEYKWVSAEEFQQHVKHQKYRTALSTLFIE